MLTREEYKQYLKIKEKFETVEVSTQTEEMIDNTNTTLTPSATAIPHPNIVIIGPKAVVINKEGGQNDEEEYDYELETDDEEGCDCEDYDDDEEESEEYENPNDKEYEPGKGDTQDEEAIYKNFIRSLKRGRDVSQRNQNGIVQYIGDDKRYFSDLPKAKQQKIRDIEKEIHNLQYQSTPLRFKIIESNMNMRLKSHAITKVNMINNMDPSSSEYYKLQNYIEALSKLPIGKYNELPVNKNSGYDKISSFLTDTRKKLDKEVYGHDEAKSQIILLLAQWISNPQSKGLVIGIEGRPGVGKCHAKDTPIMMYDGSIKLVQDIKEGDVLMGDDSTPRNVLTLGRGEDQMYDIITKKGEKYTVNSEHILCLKYSGNGHVVKRKNKNGTIGYRAIQFDYVTRKTKTTTFDTQQKAELFLDNSTQISNIVEIPVKEYIKLPKRIQSKLKEYKTGINFPEIREPPFDPYLIGVWLGDGSQKYTRISNQEATILHYLANSLPKYNLYLNYRAQYDYDIVGLNQKNGNIFLKTLQKLNMINNKHIPDIYKKGSRKTRLAVLAGIIDTDGTIVHNTCQITQKSPQLTDDILYLARSLGFATSLKRTKKNWTYKGEKKEDYYYILSIFGEGLEEIPTLVPRKKFVERKQIKDALVSGIEVKPVGRGEYYGFTIDGNHRYVMGNFTVTHNTKLVKDGICKVLGLPFGFVPLGGVSDGSFLIGHSYTYEGSRWGRIAEILMNCQCMNPILFMDELDKISHTKYGDEIINILIHLTDATQNDSFHDKYFSDIPFDMSRCLTVFSFNNLEAINPILRDRMVIIRTNGYTSNNKITIAKEYMLPEIEQKFNFKKGDLIFDDDALNYIIMKTTDEDGVRNLRRSLEEIVSKINLSYLLKEPIFKSKKQSNENKQPIQLPLKITSDIVDELLMFNKHQEKTTLPFMYI